jgi:hypothetical protein
LLRSLVSGFIMAAIEQPTLSAAAGFDEPAAVFGSELETNFDGDDAVPLDTGRVDLDRILFVFPVRRSVYNNCVAFYTLSKTEFFWNCPEKSFQTTQLWPRALQNPNKARGSANKEGGLPAPSQASQDSLGKPRRKPWGRYYSIRTHCQAVAGQSLLHSRVLTRSQNARKFRIRPGLPPRRAAP